jgi:cell division protein FtsB
MPNIQAPLIQRILSFRYLFILNLVVLAVLAVAFGREYIRDHEIQADITALQAKADELAARNLQIMELHAALQTESYIEKEARLKLGMKKPGEQVVVVKTDQNAVAEGWALTDTPAVRKTAPMAIANPTKWWYYFFDKNQFNNLDYGN